MNIESTNKPSLELGEFIGAGTYGIVFKGRYNTRKAAIKKFRLQANAARHAEIEREIDLLQRLQFRHIIQFYGTFRQGPEISLITDFAEGGSLRQAIENSRVANWTDKERIAQEIADGLAYIHHENILHRDLKSDNVLLTKHMEVKLCDFGLAVVKTSIGSHTTDTMRGTVRWMAPELLLAARPRYTNKSDMYALGMVMWEMAAMCTLPFNTVQNNYAVAMAVHAGERELLPDHTPAEYRRWVERCWKQEPSERPQADEVTLPADTASEQPYLESTSSHPSVSDTMSLTSTGTLRSIGTLLPPEQHTSTQSSAGPASVYRDAENDDVEEQMRLAKMYDLGHGAKQDDEQAFAWYRRAAQKGHLEALGRLGDLYVEGRGTDQNIDEAVACYKMVAVQRRESQSSGVRVIKKASQAPLGSDTMSWIRTSRQQLSVMMSSVSSLVSKISDSKQDAATKLADLHQSAKRGNATAQLRLGIMYFYGDPVQQNDVEAANWLTKSAIQGDSDAQAWLVCLYVQGRGVEQSDIQAVKWAAKAASQGNPDAQNDLGGMYALGQGVKQDDHMAFEWFNKSAAQGCGDAQANLAIMYELGLGVQANDRQARELFRKAVAYGGSVPPLHLKWLSSPDRWTPCNDAYAVKVNRLGAERGYAAAQFNLGILYERGRGVPKDKNQAIAWHRKAAKAGHEGSQQILEFLLRK
ncbi:hypothetical protein BGZ73_004076 [Actinomortierella ambigua]|nr:hypothetical protein BGZ73_004076 [Actinomortierella ambigua]